jgi:ABC-type antimicrobial peptide transport system permease subunit
MLHRESTRIVAPDVITLDEYYNRVVLPQRIMARASGVLAALQLLLAVAGLSGLVAYVTTLRRREIGIRTALGASGRSVIVLVMRQGVRLTLIGGAIGLLLSLAVSQVIAATMPVTVPVMVGGLVLAAGIFAFVAMIAMLLPACRALDVAPAVALRVD